MNRPRTRPAANRPMPSLTRLIVPVSLWAEVVAHARSEWPNECCGVLAGHLAGPTGQVTRCFPVRNRLASPTEYETDAADLLAAFRAMRQEGLELLAVYHSHPAAEPVPSRRDVERNTYGEGVVHLIVGLAGPAPVMRAWRLTPSGCLEVELMNSLTEAGGGVGR